jgi:hypothetical protein
MANKDLSLKPHHQKKDESWWWYEENQGISVVVERSQIPGEVGIFDIPWQSIRAALRRKDKEEVDDAGKNSRTKNS